MRKIFIFNKIKLVFRWLKTKLIFLLPKKLKKNEFEKFSLAEQKQILSEIIDNNNLYVNYSDIDDNDYQISAENKKLNHSFYGKEK